MFEHSHKEQKDSLETRANWPATHYARSFQYLSYQKKCVIPSSRNIYVTKYQVNQVSAENIGIKVSALITPS